jgi:hypothetical protein
MRKSPHEKFDSFLVFFFNFNLIHKGQRYIITCMVNASTIAKARYNHYLAFTSHSNLKFWGDCGARASAFGLNLIQIKGVCVVGLVAALPSNLKFWGDCVFNSAPILLPRLPHPFPGQFTCPHGKRLHRQAHFSCG